MAEDLVGHLQEGPRHHAGLGEVMRLVCDGRWGKLPATIKKSMPTFDMAAWHAFAKIRGSS